MRTHSTPDITARRTALALSLIPGIGPVRRRELLERCGTVERALDAAAPAAARRAAVSTAVEVLERARSLGAQVLFPEDAEFPAGMRDLSSCPPALFALGNLELLERPCAAIVGTRAATPYGARVTRALASGLAERGVVVVSGMARGIDAAAHRAALEVGGGTIAVLGTGIDMVYPRDHRVLQRDIGALGLLLSEELPGVRADGGSFPRRNRLIASQAQATIVIEAGIRSGALITATHALELGRAVAAVPGAIDSPASAGSNLLIRDGAIVIAEVADALQLFGISGAPAEPVLTDPTERAVWKAIASEAIDPDALAASAGLPARECLTALSALELAGLIEFGVAGEVRRK